VSVCFSIVFPAHIFCARLTPRFFGVGAPAVPPLLAAGRPARVRSDYSVTARARGAQI
jgi:hypothetical protein